MPDVAISKRRDIDCHVPLDFARGPRNDKKDGSIL